MKDRDIRVSPLSTYRGWEKKGRQVRKGEKAIWLCVPNTFEKEDPETGEKRRVVWFSWKPRWFALAQTDGPDALEESAAVPGWDRDRALAGLQIRLAPFEQVEGNALGYASGRKAAVSPVSPHPEKTLFHELGHVVLGHTAAAVAPDWEELPRSLVEAEAEAVALLCCEALGLPGAELSRGYIQGWLRGGEIPDASARRIFQAADAILRAGQEPVAGSLEDLPAAA